MKPTQSKFAKIKEAVQLVQLKNPHLALIHLGRGEPADPPHPSIIESLKAHIDDPSSHRYTDNDSPDLIEAAAYYLQHFYGVTLDPSTEILHTIGVKSALSILPKCFLEPGKEDVALTTSPGYDIFPHHVEFLGAQTFYLPLRLENDFLPDFASIPPEILKSSKVLLLNFPHNPTGKMPSRDFYEATIQWAIQHNIAIIHDASYGPLVYNQNPFSIFQIKDAKKIAVELHSLSKAHNMPGWRIGFVCGNSQMIQTYGAFKNFADSGQFLPIQKAAATALNNLSIPLMAKEKYGERLDKMVELLNAFGFQAKKPDGTFYIYTPSPKQVECNGKVYTFSTAEDFSLWLIEHLGIVTLPWDDVSPHVRFSLTFKSENEAWVWKELRKRLREVRFRFDAEITWPAHLSHQQ